MFDLVLMMDNDQVLALYHWSVRVSLKHCSVQLWLSETWCSFVFTGLLFQNLTLSEDRVVMQKYLQDQTINKITTFLHNNQNNQTVQLLFAQYLQEIIIADYERSLPLQELFFSSNITCFLSTLNYSDQWQCCQQWPGWWWWLCW